MKSAARGSGLVGLLALGLAACGGAPKICTKGVTQACVGSARCEGAQACLPDGTAFGPCACAPALATADAGPDAGAALDGGTGCSTTSQCPLSHVCAQGTCLEVDGGPGALCTAMGECGANLFCSAGSGLPGPSICIGECTDSTFCPGELTCVVGAPGLPVGYCLPPSVSGSPCRIYQDNGALDPRQDCSVLGSYCQPDPTNLAIGVCAAASRCDFEQQTGCAADESCRPVGTFDWDNKEGTLCVPNAAGAAGTACTSFFDCAAGLGCKLKSDGTSMCLQYCVPGSALLSCSGVNRRFADGGMGGPSTCVDSFLLPDGGPIEGASAVNSVPAGYCD